MNRKNFISSIGHLGLATGLVPGASLTSFDKLLEKDEVKNIVPPYLKRGDSIGITCPAGFITREDIQPAVDKFTEWGYEVVVGSTVGKKDFGFGGTDEERRADFQEMLDNTKIKAIMCARGGYGSLRIIDKLDFKKFVTGPKWILGFSDITVLHSHLNRLVNVASIHSKMCNSFPDQWSEANQFQKDTIDSIRDCLSGKKMIYDNSPFVNNRKGIGTGQLVGGNLKMLESLAGSRSDLVTNNKILFLEDRGEYLYSIDRMFWNLQRSGKLARLKGLIIGGFKPKPDDPGEEFGITVEEIVLEKVKNYKYPVCFNFPVGHQENNFALKCGMIHTLRVNDDGVQLLEVRTSN